MAHTPPTAESPILLGIIGAAMNVSYIFSEITGAGIILLSSSASLILGILGMYSAYRRMKSAAFYFLYASVLSVLARFSGAESSTLYAYGMIYASASIIVFQLMNIGIQRRPNFTEELVLFGISGVALNAAYILWGIKEAGVIILSSSAGLVLGILGTYFAHRKMKSAVFCFVCASVFFVLPRFSGDKSLILSACEICYLAASIIGSHLKNTGSLRLGLSDESSDYEQIAWATQVNDFISRYGVFAYHGYNFAAIECMCFLAAWTFAPKMWHGYPREFLAFWGGAVFVAGNGFFTEIVRRKYSG
ncbi:MAG: hypothetical protein IJP86_07100 [Synergistaceae bacterium]|nr:hypothetical protein [Synergistaceae bacterium]